MAKQKSQQASSGEMTVVFLHLKGGDATLQEGFKAFQAAMSRAIPQNQRLALPPAPNGNGEFTDEADEVEHDVLDVNATQVEAARTAAKRTYRSPQVLELDLTAGSIPMKEFLQRYTGDEISKRYLLIAYWLKSELNIDEVSADHIHTGFRHMRWNTPADAAQPLRAMKALGWFHKSSTRGFYKINHIGENQVSDVLKGNS